MRRRPGRAYPALDDRARARLLSLTELALDPVDRDGDLHEGAFRVLGDAVQEADWWDARVARLLELPGVESKDGEARAQLYPVTSERGRIVGPGGYVLTTVAGLPNTFLTRWARACAAVLLCGEWQTTPWTLALRLLVAEAQRVGVYALGFPTTRIAPGGRGELQAQAPPFLFRGERLFIPSDYAGSLVVEDLRVGDRSQTVGDPMPGRMFSDGPGVDLHLDPALEPDVVTLVLRNTSGLHLDVSAVLTGRVVR